MRSIEDWKLTESRNFDLYFSEIIISWKLQECIGWSWQHDHIGLSLANPSIAINQANNGSTRKQRALCWVRARCHGNSEKPLYKSSLATFMLFSFSVGAGICLNNFGPISWEYLKLLFDLSISASSCETSKMPKSWRCYIRRQIFQLPYWPFGESQSWRGSNLETWIVTRHFEWFNSQVQSTLRIEIELLRQLNQSLHA